MAKTKDTGEQVSNGENAVCETVRQDDTIGKAYAALDKIYDLLSCGDKRIELSAAKEILGLLGVPENAGEEAQADKLEVEIKIV